MTTSDVTISIGGNNVSNSVFAVNSGTSKQSGIGAAEILLENPADIWGRHL